LDHIAFASALTFQGLLECPRRLLQRQFDSITINFTIINNQGAKDHQKIGQLGDRARTGIFQSHTAGGREAEVSPAHLGEDSSTVARSVTGRTRLTTAPDPVRREPDVGGVCGPWTLGLQDRALAQAMEEGYYAGDVQNKPSGPEGLESGIEPGDAGERETGNKSLGPKIVRLTVLPVTPL